VDAAKQHWLHQIQHEWLVETGANDDSIGLFTPYAACVESLSA
jgi:hypothetical protein